MEIKNQKIKVEGIASPRKIWIHWLNSDNRYSLPEDEYLRRYNREKQMKGTFEIVATHFEWGYDGNGPKLLARSIGDEIFSGSITSKQLELIQDNVFSAPKDQNFEFILEF